MIHRALGRPVPVELTGDSRVVRRVRRLALTSLVALGLVWALARNALHVPAVVDLLLLSGWILMPSILTWSLFDPRVRYLLVLPSALVTVGLTIICTFWLPAAPFAAAGWILLTLGIALGGWLGLWLWYRLVPVPHWLDDPYARGRWALIGVHIALIVVGWLLAATSLVPS